MHRNSINQQINKTDPIDPLMDDEAPQMTKDEVDEQVKQYISKNSKFSVRMSQALDQHPG